MEEWITPLAQYGVPSVALFYVLVRVEKAMTKLTESVNVLTQYIIKTHR